MKKFRISGLFFLSFFSTCCFGKIRLPSIIGNNMVLQQKSKVAFWGKANNNSEVTLTVSWNNRLYKTKSFSDGSWKIYVETPGAGGPYKITISDGGKRILTNIMVGEVWVCSGQSNMEIPMTGYDNQPILNSNNILIRADNPQLRLFHVKRAVSNTPLKDCEGNWQVSAPESASSFSAVGFQFAQALQKILKVPVGIIESSWGGTPIEAWMDKESLAPFQGLRVPLENDPLPPDRLHPTCLFNAMISPIAGFAIAGFLWYQGETNVPHPSDYDRLMKSMVLEWRKLWKRGSLPFYYVQIAPWIYRADRDSVAILRERQQKAQDEIPHSGMVVSIDKGNEFTIHPPDKTAIADRLLYWALAQTYRKKGVACQSPLYKDMKTRGDTITITFTNAPHGFTSYDQEINGFEIAGKDKIFHSAKAIIYRNSIQVRSDETTNPVAVRYAFKDWVIGNLYNTEGLPVAPFRTDDWQ